MDDFHPLLRRQIKKNLDDLDSVPDTVRELLQKVNQSYENFENDRDMLERSLELTSDELVETNEKLRDALRKAERQAYHDPVTGLPNRNYFRDVLQETIEEWTEDKLLAVVFMDLDGFKELNDAYGHPFGDRVLEQLGIKLQDLTRDNEILARWGGDEFTLLMKDMEDRSEIRHRLETVRELFNQPLKLEETTCHLSVSMGISLYPEDGTHHSDLMSKADMAMYESKEINRTSYRFYTDGRMDKLKRNISIKNDLRAALENDEITVHYQPRIDAQTGDLRGLEALARWQHPEQGLILPGDFITVSESSGLIVPLEEQIIGEVGFHLEEWSDRSSILDHLSINFSPQHLQQDDLVSRVDQLLDEADIDPQMLEFEITETGLMKELEATTSVLEAFRDRGIGIAVDDFGTGYSSLEYLMTLPIDTVKIDRSFISKLPEDPYSQELVKIMNTLGEKLDLKVVAEGVENEEQHGFIKNYCDEIQGFLFARPKPPEEIPELVEEFRPVAVE